MRQNNLILIIDDEDDILKVLTKRLSVQGYEILTCSDGLEGLAKARSVLPDLIILDVMMPGMSGIEVKKALNEEEVTANIPVIFLTAKNETQDKIDGLRMGADDYVSKPFDIAEFLARVESLLNRRKRYEIMAMTDPLTGLANGHVFKKELDIFYRIARRYGRPFLLGLIDVDHFKQINDTYGHHTGDLVLKKIAEIMGHVFRTSDILIRYGGDEFIVLMPETTGQEAKPAFDRFRAAIEALKITFDPAQPPVSFKVSIGIADYFEAQDEAAKLFQLADQRMYREKHSSSVKEEGVPSILVIEDEEDIAKSIAFRLRKAGYKVLTCGNGEEGLRLAKEMCPDLLILDLMLPELPGEEICKAIREDDDVKFSKTPILMLTAKKTDVDRIVGKVVGANHYMTKPFDANELMRQVSKLTSGENAPNSSTSLT